MRSLRFVILLLLLASTSSTAAAQVSWDGMQWVGNVCSNGFVWQILPQFLPVGSFCQFPAQYGIIQGVIVSQ